MTSVAGLIKLSAFPVVKMCLCEPLTTHKRWCGVEAKSFRKDYDSNSVKSKGIAKSYDQRGVIWSDLN